MIMRFQGHFSLLSFKPSLDAVDKKVFFVFKSDVVHGRQYCVNLHIMDGFNPK